MPQQKRSDRSASRVNVILALLMLCIGLVIGAAIVDPLAAAGVGAVGFSGLFGFFVVAPRAGAWAKDRFLISLADPTEDEEAIMQLATQKIMHNASLLAQNEIKAIKHGELKIEDSTMMSMMGAMTELVDYRWDQTIKNLKSQATRGAGPFNPENFDEEAFKQDMISGAIQKFADPIIETLGWEGQQKQNARAYVGYKMMQAFGSNGGPGPGVRGSPSSQHGQAGHVIDHRGR